MGTVWRAEHLQLRSPVAIKFLDLAIAQDPEMAARFMREAQSAAAVRSTHVVQIFDYGVEDAPVSTMSVGHAPGGDGRGALLGTPYIVMELLRGESLEARLAARGPLYPFELDKVFSEVARAVNNAHDLGVVHRDLTPSNIFLAREGKDDVTKVLDFGIAKMKLDAPGLVNASATRSGVFMGTPRYMSPEQVRSTRDVDHCTDLWSLGIVAFECLTGRCPFVGETAGELVVQICTAEPLVPSEVADVPSGFDSWFLKATSKEKADRFTSAREMAEALHLVLEHAPRPTSSEGRATVRQPAAQQALVLMSELRVRALDAWYRLQRTLRGGVVAPLCVAAVAAVVLAWYALPRSPHAEAVQVPIVYRDTARLVPRPGRTLDPRVPAPPDRAALGRTDLGGVEAQASLSENEAREAANPAPRVALAEAGADDVPEARPDVERALVNGVSRPRSKHKPRVAPARARKPAAAVSRSLPDVPAVSPELRRPLPAVADRPSPRPVREPFSARP